MQKCGHPCCGIDSVKKCPPCLFEDCAKKNEIELKNAKGEDYCSICFVEGLINAPIMMSKCGHIYHYHCLKKR